MVVKNNSDVPSNNTILTQKLFNSAADNLGQVQINIGTLPAGQSATVTFGTTLTDKDVLQPGSYYTITQVVGLAENGNNVSSNEVKTYFDIKAKAGGILMGGFGEAEKRGGVLGASSLGPSEGSPSLLSEYEKYLPYVFVASLVFYMAIGMAKRKINGKNLVPVPAIILNEERRNKLFKNMALKIAGITSIFFSLFVILFFVYFRRNW